MKGTGSRAAESSCFVWAVNNGNEGFKARSFPQNGRVPHISPVLRDVGYHAFSLWLSIHPMHLAAAHPSVLREQEGRALKQTL